MSLIEGLEDLSDTIEGYNDQNLNEPETETFCFEPFIELLGFKRNPVDMRKQYPADISGKGRTVDYAIKKDGVPIMIVECKRLGDNLDAHTGQLSDYFTAVREARFGVLTDGRLYRFYTDLDVQRYMDTDPFLEIDLFEIQLSLVAELECFTKSRFHLDNVLAAARDLKYSKVIQQFLMRDFASPTGDFVSYVASAVDLPIDTPEQRQRITEIIQRTLGKLRGGNTDLLPDTESDPATESDQSETWKGKKIKAFTFDGHPYEVERWNEFLAKICEILSKDDTIQFEDVLQLRPKFFSRNPEHDFPNDANPKQIGETDIYVRTAVNNDIKKKIVKDLVEHFGCNMPVVHTD